jgi:hypothetical protein
MLVFLAAQRRLVHADRRRCTWMYETTNETESPMAQLWCHDHHPSPAELTARPGTGASLLKPRPGAAGSG